MSDAEQIVLYAEFTARPGSAGAVEVLLSSFTETVRAERGNIVFDVYRRPEAPDRFFVFEVYRDRAAFEAHLAAEEGRTFNSALGPLIIETGSQLSFLHPIASQSASVHS